LESTPEDHPDHGNLTSALEKAEEICMQVNEGVREKENSDRLEWLQTRVQLEGLNDVSYLTGKKQWKRKAHFNCFVTEA